MEMIKFLYLEKSSGKDIYKNGYGISVKLDKCILRTPIFATDFSRYHFSPKSNKVIIYPYHRLNESVILLDEKELHNGYPETYKYLLKYKKELESRKQYKKWFGFSAPRNLSTHDSAQIVIPLLANRGLYAELPPDNEKNCLMASGGFSISMKNDKISHKYILGLLNSKLLFYYLNAISNKFRGGWITCTKQYFGKLPIYIDDISNLNFKMIYNEIVMLVEQILTIQNTLCITKTEADCQIHEQRFHLLDQQIDKLVYELYGLTKEEIKIVEEGV